MGLRKINYQKLSKVNVEAILKDILFTPHPPKKFIVHVHSKEAMEAFNKAIRDKINDSRL